MPVIATVTKCKKCGFEVRSDWKFCPNCGDKIVCTGKYKALCAQEKTEEAADSLVARRRKEHFDELAEIARSLLEGGLEKISDDYSIKHQGNKEEPLGKGELTARLETNLDVAIDKYSPTKVFGQLFTHIEVEYPGKNIYALISTSPLEYVSIMKLMAERKTFEGRCHLYKDWETAS